MDFFFQIILFFAHVDRSLMEIVLQYGNVSYLLLVLIIFFETGLVFVPFLPGDSLLFAAGALASSHLLRLSILFPLLFVAAVIGDALNYVIGRKVGKVILKRGWIKSEHYEKAHAFYVKHGGKAIFFGRFMPIIRTFVPFVAGMSHMPYRTFTFFNVLGGFTWVGLFLFVGYFFGNLPFVKGHFTQIILAIIAISFLPLFVEVIKGRFRKQ